MEPFTRRVLVAAGPRATEAALFAELERLAPQTLDALATDAGPGRIVVPSGSLRVHLLAEMARRRPAWLGVEILTLRRLALLLFERAGATPPLGGTLLPLLVAREARREAELHGPLEPLEGGYATLVATVRDLLDAGLESVHGHPLAELLASDDVRIAFADRPRALAIARVARRAALEIERLGLAPGASLYRRAAELLAGRPELLPPGRGWIVHGFADATGSALDLLEGLAKWGPATVLLDLPESSAGSPREAAKEPFGAALRERLSGGLRIEVAPPEERAELSAFSARGESAEAREVARRIRRELAANPVLAPERVGVVARDLEVYLPALRRAFEAAALPYSVEGAGGGHPARREIGSLVRLLDRRGAAEADLAVDLLAPGEEGLAGAAELRLVLRLLGVASLAAFATLDPEALEDVRLPLRQIETDGDTGGIGDIGDAGTTRRHRRYPRARLAAHVAAVRGLARGLENLPAEAPLGEMTRALRTFGERSLPARGAARAWLDSTLDTIAGDAPGDFRVRRDELAELLGRAAETLPELPVGGASGGVQVLSVTAARGRSFDRLFLVGMRRGLFPRRIEDDPLLPDGVRHQARALLRDLPVKSEGHTEERFLFDQLIAAAPRVCFSFATVSDDGSERLVSPLLDRLSWRDATTRALRDAWSEPLAATAEPATGLPWSPTEAATRAGLERRRGDWAAALPAALAEARGEATVTADVLALASHRAAVLEEVDVDPRTPSGRRRWSRLGPYFGRVGAQPDERLFVTRVERLIACPWLDFLTRQLGLEPLPDPSLALPEPLDPVRVGIATHRLLEEIFREAMPGDPPTARWTESAGLPDALPFPERERVSRAARRIASTLLAEEGLQRWGFEKLLADALVERVEVARADYGTRRHVVGIELEGEADLAPFGAPLRLGFRADRVDREGDRFVLTDYKTGSARTIEKLARGTKLQDAVLAGRSLQPAAYVAALAGRPATGRLLALAGGEESALPPVAALDESALAALQGLARAASAAARARAAGRFLPRLVDSSGEGPGPACEHCELVEACIQEDSAARGRLARWAEAMRADLARGRVPGSDGERAESDLFLLPETSSPDGDAP